MLQKLCSKTSLDNILSVELGDVADDTDCDYEVPFGVFMGLMKAYFFLCIIHNILL